MRSIFEATTYRCGGELRIYLISRGGHTTRSGPPAWGLGDELTNPHLKNQLLAKCYTVPGNWTVSLKRHNQRKMFMRFGTWNVRTFYKEGTLKTVASELTTFKSDLVSVKQCR